MKPAGKTDKEYLPKDASSALEILMKQYGTTVLRTAYFYLGDRHLAEDVSQEVFIRAYRNWSKFNGKSSVKTWLTTITINLCRDRFRLKSSSEKPIDPILLNLTEQTGIEDHVIKRIQNTIILKHIMALPEHYHEVLYLYYYLDLSTVEISEVTGSPEGTIRGRLHRAREMIANILKKEGLDDEKRSGSTPQL